MCHLGNTVVICVWLILALEKIGDSLLELAKQMFWKQKAFFSCFKKYVNNQKLITRCFILGGY